MERHPVSDPIKKHNKANIIFRESYKRRLVQITKQRVRQILVDELNEYICRLSYFACLNYVCACVCENACVCCVYLISRVLNVCVFVFENVCVCVVCVRHVRAYIISPV